ncbi:hypothetical protein [Marinobacterium lutimaris]|uniref:Uncharacterized protein n=1 Tax=Marinobacterium lutimaris TaxID=568106 RepID=A0A1H5XP82_9GAMM|nr:hypothetical protein [Marinobacterium lutimaris]SEG13534.1 hypothetical protein SAMN05444390_1011454 [Marinobacterium lutimaris]
MLSKDLCERIWHCHREIDAGLALLVEVEKIAAENIKRRQQGDAEQGITDKFGRDQHLQLGVPTSDNSHRLYSVSFELAMPVIRAHISNKKAELTELNEVAKLEMSV